MLNISPHLVDSASSFQMGIRYQLTWIIQLRHGRQTPSSVWMAEDPCRQPLLRRGGYEYQLSRIRARRILNRSDGGRGLQGAFSRALWGSGFVAGDHGWWSSVISSIVNFPNVILLVLGCEFIRSCPEAAKKILMSGGLNAINLALEHDDCTLLISFMKHKWIVLKVPKSWFMRQCVWLWT